MSDKVIKVYKKCGETPLECINNLKKDNPELKFLPMTYAGRLDPLAEGVLIILVGDECLKKDEYLVLPKEYEVEILFGFATDTYDVLGKVLQNSTSSTEAFERSSDFLAKFFGKLGQTISNTSLDSVLEEAISSFVGRINQSYPPYSSRTVKNKPLWQWAREEKLSEIEIPTHDVFVESIDNLGWSTIKGNDLLLGIREKILKVNGDFRQKEIISGWENILEGKSDFEYQILKLKITCGSGVYVRGIANNLGKSLGFPALAFKIIRTKIGDFI